MGGAPSLGFLRCWLGPERRWWQVHRRPGRCGPVRAAGRNPASRGGRANRAFGQGSGAESPERARPFGRWPALPDLAVVVACLTLLVGWFQGFRGAVRPWALCWWGRGEGMSAQPEPSPAAPDPPPGATPTTWCRQHHAAAPPDDRP